MYFNETKAIIRKQVNKGSHIAQDFFQIKLFRSLPRKNCLVGVLK